MQRKDLWQIKEQLYHLSLILNEVEKLVGAGVIVCDTLKELVVAYEKKE